MIVKRSLPGVQKLLTGQIEVILYPLWWGEKKTLGVFSDTFYYLWLSAPNRAFG